MAATLNSNPFDLFPDHRHLGTEESGNEIIVDRTGGADGPVYGLWHDPPAVVVLAQSEAAFRAAAPEFGDNHPTVPDLIEKLIALPAAATPLSRDEALTGLEAKLHDWIAAFPPETRFVDLRPGTPGSGFAWTLRDTFAKHEAMAVFAIHSAPKQRGWLGKLLGR